MAIIDGFKMVEEKRVNKDMPYITLRNRSINFSKKAIEDLNYAKYVHMYVDEKGKRVAFVPCADEDNAIAFYRKPKEGRQLLVRLSDVKKAKMLMNLAGIDDCGKGLRFYGEFYKEEMTLVISMDLKEQEKYQG